MNLNKKIAKFSGDGIPEYNKRINEVIDAANWLLGIRTINGKPITESDQGPILDLSQVNTTQTAPGGASATDPDGNQAGWQKILFIDPNYASTGLGFLIWAWSGPTLAQNNLSWLKDPNGNRAGWVQHDVCINGQIVSKWFWGSP